jgi:hypothetical protein
MACNVEIISAGHFNETLMAKLPDGRIVEVNIDDLTTREKT